MADVRSLLRQQRAARRIVHPHASYSDTGKLLCTVCHEQVKAESRWDGHIRSPAHLQRVQKLQASGPRPSEDATSASHKRKHEDQDMDDVSTADGEEDGLRKKRSRLNVQDAESGREVDSEGTKRDEAGAADKTPSRIKTATPPLPRRTSGTPSQGVEIQIPSRPATPVAVRAEAANGAGAGAGRSPLRPRRESSTLAGFVPPAGSTTAMSTSTTTTATPQPVIDATPSGPPAEKGAQDVNEDEWAAFEADLLHNNTNGTTARPGLAEMPADAVISAPVMTADEVAAKSAEEERERRRLTADIDLDNEKEDATRALEEEFEDMEELEARVRRLKERREALRQHRGTPPVTAAREPEEGKRAAAAAADGKENAEGAEESDEDEEDDDEDADDWAGFRFKG